MQDFETLNNEKVSVKLLSGLNVNLSEKVHDECYCDFDEPKYLIFNNIITSGQYFPQIMQFIFVVIAIFNERTSFLDIFICNLLSGIFYTIIWFLFRFYKIPGINSICYLIGETVFKHFLHFVAIAIVSLFVINNWKVILFCMISGIITFFIKTLLYNKFSNVKYADEVAIYVSKFKT